MRPGCPRTGERSSGPARMPDGTRRPRQHGQSDAAHPTSSAPRTPRARSSPSWPLAVREAGGEPLVRRRRHARGRAAPSTFSAAEVAAYHPGGARRVLGSDDRGTAVAAMARGLRRASSRTVGDDRRRSSASAAAAAPRSSPPACARCPFGVPKVMVSTLASGDVAPYVGVSDIVMMHSVDRRRRAQPHQPRRSWATPPTPSPAWPARPAPPTDAQAGASASPCSASPRPA